MRRSNSGTWLDLAQPHPIISLKQVKPPSDAVESESIEEAKTSKEDETLSKQDLLQSSVEVFNVRTSKLGTSCESSSNLVLRYANSKSAQNEDSIVTPLGAANSSGAGFSTTSQAAIVNPAYRGNPSAFSFAH